MNKLLIIPGSIEMIEDIDCDAILLGIRNYSVNLPFYIEMSELKEIIKKTKKEIFISLNKNIHNNELEGLKKILTDLNQYNIKGVFFYDTSIVNLKKKLNFKYDLIWNQEHLTTNFYTSNFWNKNGVQYTCLSNEITLREIKEIKQKTNSKLIVPMFGYIPMMNSKRHLVNNYLNEFNLKDNSQYNYIEKENKKYLIVDNESGTTVYTSEILNGIKDAADLDVEYVLLNSFMIDKELFKKVVNLFKNVTNENKNEYNEEINNMFNADTYFLHKETIYKVK